jgi:hypothetical protein
LLADNLDGSDISFTRPRVERMNLLDHPKPTAVDGATYYVFIVHANRLALVVRLRLYRNRLGSGFAIVPR